MARRPPYQVHETAGGRVYRKQVTHPVTGARAWVSAATPSELETRVLELRRLRLGLRAGEDPSVVSAQLAQRVVDRRTLRQRFEHQQKEYPATGETRAKRSATWQQRLDTHFGGLTAAACDRSVMRQWLADMQARDYAPKTIEDAFYVLKTAVNRALEEGEIARIPWGDWRPPKGVPRRVRRAAGNIETLSALLTAAREYDVRQRGRRDHNSVLTMLLVLTLTGLRQAEAAALSWADLELDQEPALVRVRYQARPGWRSRTRSARPEDPTKSRRQHVQRLHATVVDALRLHRSLLQRVGLYAADGPVFPTAAGGYRTRLVLPPREVRAVVELAGLPNANEWTTHSTRHSFATLELIASSGDLRATAERTGHCDIATLKTYIHEGAGVTLGPSAVPELPATATESLAWRVQAAVELGELPPSVQLPRESSPVPSLALATAEHARQVERDRIGARRAARSRALDYGAEAAAWVAAGEPRERGVDHPPAVTLALRQAYTRGYQRARYAQPAAPKSTWQLSGRRLRASVAGAWAAAVKRARAAKK